MITGYFPVMYDKNINAIKIKFRKIIRIATWGLIVMLLLSTYKNVMRSLNIKKQVDLERQKVEKMQEENAKLQAQITESQGTEFIEEQIRNKLGFSKNGESVVVLPDEDIVKSFAPPLTTNTESLPDPNWMKWKKLFF